MNEFLKRKRALSPLFLGSWLLVFCALFAKSESGVVLAAERESKSWQAKPGKTSGWAKKASRLSRQADALAPTVCFVGDSLTEFWSAQGSPVWQLEFHDKKAANLGMAADRVENILWRLKNGGLEKIRPKVFVLMLGTNNLSKPPADLPDEVVLGITSVLNQIQVKVPESRILLLSILPNGYESGSTLRKSILKTNEGLQKLSSGERVDYIDLHDAFLNSAGSWKPGLTVDGTHLTMRGYDVLMNQLRASLVEAMK